jgi:hypothetical protein
MDPLGNQNLGSTLPGTIQGSSMATSSSSYPTLNSAVDREIERQRRRMSPGREWSCRKSTQRDRSASTSSYRSSRRSSNAAMAYQTVPGLAAQQPLPPPSSESPAFNSLFLAVSSSPPTQGYYSPLAGSRFDGRSDPPSFEYPPLPSQPLYPL